MWVIIGILAAVLVLSFVLEPVVRRRQLEEIEAERWDLGRADLEAQRDLIYRDLRDLEFDHRVGKLGDADYQQMRRRLQRQAAAVLMQLDETESGYEQVAEARIRERRQIRACPVCSSTITTSVRFCPNCGRPVTKNGE